MTRPQPNETLIAIGACAILFSALLMAWLFGILELTPPAPNRSPVEDLPKIERGAGPLQVEIGGRVISVEEKR